MSIPDTDQLARDKGLSIRAGAPNPLRLSRTVLLAGAVVLMSLMTLALFFGLSRPGRRAPAPPEAMAAAGGPPETIRNAPGQYAAGDLVEAPLEAPKDRIWGDHRPPTDGDAAPPSQTDLAEHVVPSSAAPSRSTPAPDPESVARTSAILFSREDATAGREEGRGRDEDARLVDRLEPPRSRFEVLAGSVIPAALVTALNSDLPGAVIAQVTANVFDSVSGDQLLIPQGARLIGEYRPAPSHGEQRLLLIWTRLVFPNGWSIGLRGMPGTDPSGASGVGDHTDNHLRGLSGAIALSAAISVIAENAQNDKPASLAQSVGDAAAAQAAQTGGRIVDRELDVRPTLRVRAGAPVRVLVNRDIALRPYRE